VGGCSPRGPRPDPCPRLAPFFAGLVYGVTRMTPTPMGCSWPSDARGHLLGARQHPSRAAALEWAAASAGGVRYVFPRRTLKTFFGGRRLGFSLRLSSLVGPGRDRLARTRWTGGPNLSSGSGPATKNQPLAPVPEPAPLFRPPTPRTYRCAKTHSVELFPRIISRPGHPSKHPGLGRARVNRTGS